MPIELEFEFNDKPYIIFLIWTRVILDSGLPESLFVKVHKGHHAEGKLDNQMPLRIKKIKDELILDNEKNVCLKKSN